MRTIERCRDLGVLAQILARRPQGSSLRMVRGTKTREHHLVLVAPATVALCALDAGLVSDGRKTLRLLMINAGMLDALDEGQWYRYVPLMIDSRASMQVTANVPDRSVMEDMLEGREWGLPIMVITNSLASSDERLVHADYRLYRTV